MKKRVFFAAVLTAVCLLTACFGNLTSRESIVKVYNKHEDKFIEAAENGSFSDLEKIRGVQRVLVWDDYVNVEFGGSGFGPNTSYYGIFFSETDNLCAVDVSGPLSGLVEYGDGYRYVQPDGDNIYYVEPLGNHYFYYESHF